MGGLIQFEGVSHLFKDKHGREITALNNVSLSIEEGEFVAVVGENGSGKSTFAKHINALLVPSTGRVTVDSFDTSDSTVTADIRRRVGYVFQNPDNQIVAATVEEDVAFGPENLGLSREEIRKRVDEALGMVMMTQYRSWAPHLLSGGQKQRVAIAGALAMRPRYLVFDEPTAMLDPQGRNDVITTVDILRRQYSMTIVLITHHMSEVVLADRVIMLHKGSVILDGTPRAVFKHSDLLFRYGLTVPPATEIALCLRARGLEVPDGCVTLDELVEEICQLRSRN